MSKIELVSAAIVRLSFSGENGERNTRCLSPARPFLWLARCKIVPNGLKDKVKATLGKKTVLVSGSPKLLL
jgi:hypothetical protein